MMATVTDTHIASIPKVELHCHLNLTMDLATFRTLLDRGHKFPVSYESIEAAFPAQTREEFARLSALLEPLRRDMESLKPFLELHIERLIAQNVVYTELMMGTRAIGGVRPLEQNELLAKMRNFREFANGVGAGKTQIEFLIGMGSHNSLEDAEAWVPALIALYEAGLIVGVSMTKGPEEAAPIGPFRHILAQLHQAGLGIEVHAGEWAGPESVLDALENGFADRIGHGLAIFQDPDLLKLFQERQIHVEFCPTSNVKTEALARLEDHPLRLARDLGLNFSINSDDPGAFGCSIESEYRLAAEVFGFDIEHLMKVSENALRSRFQLHSGAAESNPPPHLVQERS